MVVAMYRWIGGLFRCVVRLESLNDKCLVKFLIMCRDCSYWCLFVCRSRLELASTLHVVQAMMLIVRTLGTSQISPEDFQDLRAAIVAQKNNLFEA